MVKKYLFICLSLLTHSTISNAYNAVVFEYSPINQTSPRETIEKNADNIANEILNLAKSDIVVFPEYAITTKDFNPANFKQFAVEIPENVNFCDTDDADLVLKKLACAAKTILTYLAVNLLEIDGKYVYNTNIVFDRNGTIVHKYRKLNLDHGFEKQLTAGNKLPKPFVPDFGGKFVSMTGNDIIRKYPGVDVFTDSDDASIGDVIYPNLWFSELPFKTALAVQSGYAKRFGINLLSAGYSKPVDGNGGSGIFTANENDNVVSVSPAPAIKMLRKEVSPVTKRQPETLCKITDEPLLTRGLVSRPNIDKFFVKLDVDERFSSYNFQTLTDGEHKNAICSNDNRICCNYEVDIVRLPSNFTFAVVAYSDKSKQEYGCGLVSCENSLDLKTCGKRFKGNDYEIGKIKLELEQDNLIKQDYVGFPSTVTYELENVDGYRYCTENGKVEMGIERTLSSISTFGFFGKSTSFAVKFTVDNLLILFAITAILFKQF